MAVMATMLTAERYPVLRRGERDEIAPQTRYLVHERDGWHCLNCGWQTAPGGARGVLQLDHVIPWSALGSDRSDNLRTLCGECNEERSNFKEWATPRIIGVTAACYWCAVACGTYLPYSISGMGEVDWIHAYCGQCGTTSSVPQENWIL